MQLDTHAKGTISYSLLLVLAMTWVAISPVFEPPWEPWPPLVPLMSEFAVPFVNQLYRPLLIALTGIAVFLVWEGRRIGYVVALVLAVVGLGFMTIITVGNIMNQTWIGAFTTACATVPALLASYHAFQGYRLFRLHPDVRRAPRSG